MESILVQLRQADRLPIWVRWITVDSDFTIWGYECKPNKFKDGFWCQRKGSICEKLGRTSKMKGDSTSIIKVEKKLSMLRLKPKQ